jgi:CheY-like chemotaxis protein
MGKTVAIFDDEEEILFLCTFLLEEMGYCVHTFTDTENVLGDVAECSPDLILMDNWIPGLGGVEATRAIKAHPSFCSIPVIYFSANTNIANLANEAGADTYIAKPFQLEAMEAKIRRFAS